MKAMQWPRRPALAAEAKAHALTFRKYPPKNVGLNK